VSCGEPLSDEDLRKNHNKCEICREKKITSGEMEDIQRWKEREDAGW